MKDRLWYDRPRLKATPRLIEMRNQLRRENLHDTEEPPMAKKPALAAANLMAPSPRQISRELMVYTELGRDYIKDNCGGVNAKA